MKTLRFRGVMATVLLAASVSCPIASAEEVVTLQATSGLRISARELEEEAAKAEQLAAHPPVPQSSRQSDGRRDKRGRKAARPA